MIAHKFSLAFGLILVFCSVLTAQNNKPKDYRYRKFAFSMETAGQFVYSTLDTMGRVDTHLSLFSMPNISYYFNGTTGLGIVGEYHFVKSDFVSMPPLYGVGIFVRQYSPYYLKIDEKYRCAFVGELSYRFLNYYRKSASGVYDIDNHLKYRASRLFLGTSFRVWKGFRVEFGMTTELFFRPAKANLLPRLSLEYHI